MAKKKNKNKAKATAATTPSVAGSGGAANVPPTHADVHSSGPPRHPDAKAAPPPSASPAPSSPHPPAPPSSTQSLHLSHSDNSRSEEMSSDCGCGHEHCEDEQLPLRALSLWQEGNRLYKEECYQDAIALYTEAIAMSGSCPSFLLSLLHNRALSHLRARQHEQAIENCDSIHLLDESDVPAWIIKTVAFLHLKRFPDALSSTQATERILCTPPWDVSEMETRPVLQKLNETLAKYQVRCE